MNNGLSNGKQHSFISKIARFAGFPNGTFDDEAPAIENLEPRVLLSANPLADTLKHQDDNLLNYQPAIFMPLSTTGGTSFSPLAEQNATVTILSPEYNAYHNGSVDVRASIIQGNSDISKWTVKVINESTGRTYTIKTGNGLPTSELLATFSARSYGAGACRIEIEVLDKAGNAVTQSQSFNIDIAAPTVAIASPATNSRQNGVFQVTGSIADTDTSDELSSWTLSLKNNSSGEIFVITEGTGKRTNEVLGTIDPAQFASGDYTLLLDARDAAGNSKSTSRAIKLDGFAPEVAISSDIQEVDARQYVTFTIGATDDIGVSSRKLTINDATYSVSSNGVLKVRLDKAGVFEAVAEVADAAGNIGRATMLITVLDVYKPEVTLNAPANNASIGSPTDVYAYIRDYDSPSVNWTLTLTNKTTGAKYIVSQGTHNTTGTNDRILLDQIIPSQYSDGEYLLTVDMVDTAGNIAQSGISLKLDTTAPVIESVTLNQTDVETFKPVIFTIAASDNFAVSRYELYINGEKVTVAATGKSSSYTFKEAGIYKVEAYAYDAAGNFDLHTFNLVVTETEDLKAPTISISSPALNAAYNKNVAVNVTIKDADSLVINWTAKLINNTTGQEELLGSGNMETANLVVATLSPGKYADGSYTLVVEAVDKGSNRTVLSRDFCFDTVAPEVFVEAETSRLEVGHTIWFQISENDASTISRRTFLVNGKSVTLDASGRGKYIFDTSGEHTLTATVTDAAGNVGTVTRTIIVTENSDFLAPTVEITSPDAYSYNGGMTSVRGTISDSDSESVSWTVQLRYPNGTTVRVLGTGTGMVANEELVSFNAASYASGLYTIEVVAVDPTGNTSLATQEIYIDRYAPTISITGPASNAQIKEPVNITGTLTDRDTIAESVAWTVTITNSSTGDIFTVLSGTGEPVNGVFGVLDPSLYPSATYKLILEAVDAGGNKATVSRNVKIDAVAPDVTITSDVEGIEPGQYVTFTMGATDDIGISTRKLFINGTTYNVGTTGVLRVRLTTIGVFEVIAEATDAAGNIGRAAMQIAVGVDTVAPVIDSVSIDKSTVEAYLPVTLTINASDNYAITRYEMYINGVAIDVDNNGNISGYMFKKEGINKILVLACDAAGNEATYETSVFVYPTFDIPVLSFSHNIIDDIYQGQTVDFFVATTGNVEINSVLLRINGQSIPVGPDGRVSYTFNEPGSYSVEAIATNIAGNSSSRGIRFEVFASVDTEKPVVNIAHNASSSINPGQNITFVVTADDNVGIESLNFTINGQEISIGTDGRVNYQFTALGSYVIKATATDAAGNIGVKEMTLNVVDFADTEAPAVSVIADKTNVTEGGTVNFTIAADDNVGVTTLTLTINGQNVNIDVDGNANFTFTSMGTYTALVTAVDAAGNVSTDSIEIKVFSANDVKAPTVSISSPALNTTISNAIDITGTIADVDSPEIDWVVTLTDLENNVWVAATGTGKFSNGKICELNPSNFSNGTYTLTVTAEDPAGHRASASRQVKILSEYKVGNFELPFEDLKIDLGGMPINIVRKYDASNAKYKGDFGYGWDLEYIPVSLETNVKGNPRGSWSILDSQGSFQEGTRILVKLPDGTTAGYTVHFSQQGLFGQWSMSLQPDAGVTARLEIVGPTRQFRNDYGDFITSSGYYHPASTWYNDSFRLTTEDGMVYSIDAITGLATQAVNSKGERITISSNGFTSYNNAGEKIGEVTFARDSQGRITTITDPDGFNIDYEYDDNGDLHAVTNREGERLFYGYVSEKGVPQHHLETLTDSRGVTVMRVMYDFVTGRIASIVDAAGNPITVGYTVQIGNGMTSEIITDAMGNISETVYDVAGNVIRTIQHIADLNEPQNTSLKRYLVTVNEYNAAGKLIGTARAFTVSEVVLAGSNDTLYTYVPDDLFWTVRNVFDAKGNLSSSFNSYGKETKYTYDAKGNILTITDPFGKKTTNEYNSQSQLIKTTTAIGVVTKYIYDGKGNLLRLEETQPGSETIILSEMTYDASGRVKTSTSQTGDVTEYKYDGSGRIIETRTKTIDPHNPALIHVSISHTQYDKEGRVLASWQVIDDVEVSRTTTEYDGVGQLTATVDRHGLRTEYTRDILGRTVETRRQSIDASGNVVWLVSRTVYDRNGRTIWQTDEHIESDPVHPEVAWATHTIYDQLGREVAKERRSGVLVTVDPVDGFPVAELANAGQLFTRTARGYDDAGRIWWSENESGVKTVNVYDRYGAVSHTITDFDGDLSTTTDQKSSGKTVYDEYGRQVEQVLDQDGDLTTTGDQTSTKYEYDVHSRVVKTIYADGTFTLFSYDEAGRKASETDQLGQTTRYEYDGYGRLTAVVLPQVMHPVTGAMVHVRYEYGYDTAGNQISLKDNIFQTDPANPSSIDRTGARETTFAYDWRGNQISRTLADGLTEYFFYDNEGRQIRHVSFEGRVIVLEYDACGYLKKKLYFTSESNWNNGSGLSSHTVNYTYDAFGRVLEVADSLQSPTKTEYDELGRVTRVDSQQGVVNYEYDALTGQVSRTWTGLDSSNPITDVVNAYDSLGRLESVTTYAREGAALSTPEMTRYVYNIIGTLDRIINANDVVSDYVYDELNRLKELTHYAPDATPETLADNPILQRYRYSYYANGNKSQETFTDADGKVHTWDWVYDALGRLTREVHDNADNSLDYTTNYVYNLVGNRLRKETDQDNDGTIEEVIVSEFDANDRHLNEIKIFNGTATQRTDYVYNRTEQIAKTVTDLVNSRIESQTTMEYNDQGRMSKIIVNTYVDDILAKVVTQEYVYNSSGIKVKQTEMVDLDADGDTDSTKVTEYLNVDQNHTGHSQVLEERTKEDGGPVEVTAFTIGLDVLTQANTLLGVLTLLADGHGSTRAVADSLGDVLQQYNYDAYGNALGFNASEAMTSLLYSGEQFNPVSGLQYLRARWYNPQSGTFNRLDPYSGNRESPLSFHKYAYAHMNPVMGTDPTGMFFVNIATPSLNILKWLRGSAATHTWTAQEIARFNGMQTAIRALKTIGDRLASGEPRLIPGGDPAVGVPKSIIDGHNEFKTIWKSFMSKAITYQQTYYGVHTKWGFIQPGDIGYSSASGTNYSSFGGIIKLNYDHFKNSSVAAVINTIIHEPQHDFSRPGTMLIGHSYMLETSPNDFIHLKWDTAIGDQIGYVLQNATSSGWFSHLFIANLYDIFATVPAIS